VIPWVFPELKSYPLQPCQCSWLLSIARAGCRKGPGISGFRWLLPLNSSGALTTRKPAEAGPALQIRHPGRVPESRVFFGTSLVMIPIL